MREGEREWRSTTIAPPLERQQQPIYHTQRERLPEGLVGKDLLIHQRMIQAIQFGDYFTQLASTRIVGALFTVTDC